MRRTGSIWPVNSPASMVMGAALFVFSLVVPLTIAAQPAGAAPRPPVEGWVVQAITNDEAPDHAPSIDGDWVAWVHGQSMTQEDIWAFDLLHGELVRVTDNEPDSDSAPCASNMSIVWTHSYTTDHGFFEHPMLFDLWTRTTSDLSVGFTDERDISSLGPYAAWSGFDSVDDEILLRNLAAGITTQITVNAVPDTYPVMCPGYLLWVRSNEDSTQSLIAYDYLSGWEHVVFTSSRYITDYRAEEGTVAFVIRGEDVVPDTVWLWRGGSEPAMQIGDGGTDANIGSLDVAGGYVCWDRVTSSMGKVLLYEIATAATQVLSGGLYNCNPTLIDGTVAFLATNDIDIMDGTVWLYDIHYRRYLRLGGDAGMKNIPAIAHDKVAWILRDVGTEVTDLAAAYVPYLDDIGPIYPHRTPSTHCSVWAW